MILVASSESDLRWRTRHLAKHRKTVPIFEAIAKMSTLERREIERLANLRGKFTREIRRAFLDAINKIQDGTDSAEILRLLKAGSPQQAIDYVNEQLTARDFEPISAMTSKLTLEAGTAASVAADLPPNLEFVFSHTNPATIERLRVNEFRLIRELSDTSRQNVAAVIRQGVADGRNPLDVATDVRDFIGLTERQSRAVMNYRDALENGSSDALDRALRDRRFDSTVRNAMDGNGLSQAQIDRMTERYQERFLTYRAETIARTEAMRAVNEGNTESWRQATTSGKLDVDQVTREWVYTLDDRTRDAHIEIPDMNPDGVGLDEPFDTPLGPLMYPGDPDGEPENTINCRCSVVIRYKDKDEGEE